jgi:response regulator RpfG family c-di-GMP phosphodiesterase
MNLPVNQRLLERMVTDGIISEEQREATLNHVQAFGDRFEEALIDNNAVTEAALLKYLAGIYQTRFVSTEKLAKADIDRNTLEKVPKKLAVAHGVFPVLFDAKSNALSIVTADPDNATALDEIKLVSGAREVRAFVARPRAVKAAVAKAYSGDIHAFANLDRAAHAQFTSMLDVYERNLVSDESMTVALAREDRPRERVIGEDELKGGGDKVTRGQSEEGYIETLNVLVSLLENSRQDLRGHSAQVSRLIKKLAERIGLSGLQLSHLQIAAFLHDLGKAGAYHLTPLNVAEYEGHATQARKTLTSPARLMEAVGLAPDTRSAVEGMYERFDGQGFPHGAKGKDISLGARILAICDTYADLTQNPRNPFRKRLRPVEACEVLARYKGSIFDPNLVDLFKHTVTGEDLKARLLANRHRALIVDPDPEETTVLELRMVEQGFEVQQAHTAEQGLKHLQSGEFELVVSEIDLGGSTDGYALLTEARNQEWGKRLPWIFVTSRSASADARRAFELGAADFMQKPVSADLLVAKIKQIMEREAAQGGGASRGVSGSLTEMGLPDMVQVLWHGRKSGSLKIRSGQSHGEIHFVKGLIVNALWMNQRGEEAFYAMLKLDSGTFALDPNFEAGSQVIQASPEALLLEGMRRMDEGDR